MLAIGCDIGGHHISAAPVDIPARQLTSHRVQYRDVDRKASAATLFNAWADAIMAAIEPVGIENVRGVGIAMPGPFNYRTGEAKFAANDKFEARRRNI